MKTAAILAFVFVGVIAVNPGTPTDKLQSSFTRVGRDAPRPPQSGENVSLKRDGPSPPPAPRAESTNTGSDGYSLADALIPYAKGDYGRALDLLTPLALRGDAVAQLKLGIIFSRGQVGSSDHSAALRWFTKAAENGQAEAEFQLGRMYRDGLGVNIDGKLAVYWLTRAAEKGVSRAINALGELYLGYQDVPQNFALAMSWFLRGAAIGNSKCMYNIGVRYALEEGVLRDEVEALKWFELAAEGGLGEDRDRALRAVTLLAEQLTPMEVLWGKGRAREWNNVQLSISDR